MTIIVASLSRVIENSIAVCEEDIEEYKSYERDTDEKINNAYADILELEKELRQQKKIRECREACEEVARTVNLLPTRSSMRKRAVEVDQNKKNALELIKVFQSRIVERYKQFSAAVDTIEAVQDSLAEDLKAQIDPSLVDAEASDDEDEDRGDRKRTREEQLEEGGFRDLLVDEEEHGGGGGGGGGGATEDAEIGDMDGADGEGDVVNS